MTNTATATFDAIKMNQGKARHYGGAIYVGGTGSSSLSITNCAQDVTYFDSYFDGGFLYTANGDVTLASSSCCYNHIHAR